MVTDTPGVHHVTAMVGDPQPNLEFYAGVLGLRPVKRTVNHEDVLRYQFYYGDGEGPGTPGAARRPRRHRTARPAGRPVAGRPPQRGAPRARGRRGPLRRGVRRDAGLPRCRGRGHPNPDGSRPRDRDGVPGARRRRDRARLRGCRPRGHRQRVRVRRASPRRSRRGMSSPRGDDSRPGLVLRLLCKFGGNYQGATKID